MKLIPEAHAQIVTRQLGPLESIGPVNPTDPGGSLSEILALALQVVLVVAGIWAFLNIVFGAYTIISSGGDAQKVAEGRGKVMFALIGLFVVLAAWGLIWFAQKVTNSCFGIGCSITIGV